MQENMFTALFGAFIIAVSSGLIYLGLSPIAMGLYLVLLTADFVSGVLKSIIIGEVITAQRMRVGLFVKVMMWILPIILALTATIANVDGRKMFEWGLTLLSASEAYSFICNVYTMKTGKELPKIDALAIIGNKLRKLINSKIGEENVK